MRRPFSTAISVVDEILRGDCDGSPRYNLRTLGVIWGRKCGGTAAGSREAYHKLDQQTVNIVALAIPQLTNSISSLARWTGMKRRVFFDGIDSPKDAYIAKDMACTKLRS